MTTDERLRAALHELATAAARQTMPAVPPRSAPDGPRRRLPRPAGRYLLTLGAAALLVVLVVQAFTLTLPDKPRDGLPADRRTPTPTATAAPTGTPSTATTGPVVTRTVTLSPRTTGPRPPATDRPGAAAGGRQWTAVAGATSVYSPDPGSYQAVVRSSTYGRGTLTVGLAADGRADLAPPDGTCLVVTSPDGSTFEVAPDRVDVSTSSPGHVTAAAVYSSLQPGAVALRYACRGDYTTATIGTLAAPARGTWMPARGQASVSGADGGTLARVESSNVTGRRVTVGISTTGSGLPDAAETCLRVTSRSGTATLKPARAQIVPDASGNPSGTLTYERVPSGIVTLVYGCDAGWSAARVGVLG